MAELTIAIDAMGGDFGPSVTVPAALRVLRKHSDTRLVLVGKEGVISDYVKQHNNQSHERLSMQHATEEVLMTDSPSLALRKKKDSSMRVAINLVKEQKAMACVSAGNTGALMATARFVLKTLKGVDRPAIIATFPTLDPNQIVRVLDLGANINSSAENLYQFAVMGSVVAKAVDGITRPRIALMNIGVEQIKGNEQIKRASELLSNNPKINYIGYVEGNDIFAGIADVIVCDGFVGNVSLKTMEGTAKLIGHFIKDAFHKTPYSRFVGLLAKNIMSEVSYKMDAGRRNGASLLGLKGIVVKSHGAADVDAFASAIEEAIQSVKQDLSNRTGREVGLLLEQH